MSQKELFPRKSVTEKLKTWKRQSIPLPEEEAAAYRQLVIEAVFSVHNLWKRPTDLQEIYEIVKKKVEKRLEKNTWPHVAYCRSKRTIDRRVNEAASPDFNDGTVKIVAVSAGIYQVNPALLGDSE